MKTLKTDSAALSWIYGHIKGERLRLFLLILGNILFAAASVGFALICKEIVDGAVEGKKYVLIINAAALFMLITVILLLRLMCNGLNETIRAGLEKKLRSMILDMLLKKSYKDVSAYHSGDLLNRMMSDVSVISEGITSTVPSAANMLTGLIGAAAVLLTLDRSFTLIFIGAGTVLFLVAAVFRKTIKRLHKDVQEKGGVMRSFLQETLERLLVIRIFGAEEKMSYINKNNQQSHYNARLKRRSISVLAGSGFSFIFEMGYLYAIVWGAFGILGGSMSYGTLTAILQLVNRIQQPFASLSGLIPKFYGMLASAERIMELEEMPEEKKPEKELSYNLFRSIELIDAGFSYGENRVLKNTSLSIDKGETVSLTGISGGGKSTLFLLLTGIYSPDSGSIIFRSDKGDYAPGNETRRLFAYVPQGNCLFSGTVYDNITFLNETATEEEVFEAMRIACVDEFIGKLPDGADTKIGENGYGVSEGQAQRIAVARAVLSKAPILLLDEATSALDEQTEARLLKNLSEEKNKTVLIVTHRKAALSVCTKRLILNEGVISYGEV